VKAIEHLFQRLILARGGPNIAWQRFALNESFVFVKKKASVSR